MFEFRRSCITYFSQTASDDSVIKYGKQDLECFCRMCLSFGISSAIGTLKIARLPKEKFKKYLKLKNNFLNSWKR